MNQSVSLHLKSQSPETDIIKSTSCPMYQMGTNAKLLVASSTIQDMLVKHENHEKVNLE